MPSDRGHRAAAQSPAGATSRTRRLDLDVVRGAAIVLALGWHFGGPSGNVVLDALQWPGEHIGWAGVDLFFVLSGFLMGRLVLGEHGRTGTFDGRRFSLRRILKLWPVLYLFLAVQVLFGSESLGSYLWQNALHVQNIAGTSFAHLWSLAVEEHFYLALALLFPVFVKRGGSLKLFAGILAGVIAAMLAFRLIGSWAGVSDVRLQWRTWFHLDGLAAGVLLAVVSVRWPERFQALQDRRRPLLAVLAAGVAVLALIGKSGPLGSTFGFTVAWGTAAAALLLTYRATWVPRVRWIAAPVAALGRYSYGINIWHIFAAGTVLGWLGMDREDSTPLAQLVKYGSAIVVGVAATLLVERPVLRLRDRIWPGTDDEQRSVSEQPAPAPQVLPQEVPVLQAPVLLARLTA
jgi:peptidoglycan/LPS O-acetylase OafA/YrhL